MKSTRHIFASLVCALALGACGGGTDNSPKPLDPATQPAAFVKTDTLVGAGTEAAANDFVTVKYSGWLYNSSLAGNHGSETFDTGTISFTLGVGKVIPGWDQGIAGLKVGGKRTLVIPSNLGYGPDSSPKIPAYSGLVFDVELTAVTKAVVKP